MRRPGTVLQLDLKLGDDTGESRVRAAREPHRSRFSVAVTSSPEAVTTRTLLIE
jgi:hypothetical protein